MRSVAKQPAPTSALQTYNEANQFIQTQQGALTLQTPFQDVDTIATPAAYAQQHGLQSVGDLGKVGPGGQGVTVAGPVEFQTRQTGLVGMKQVYNLPNLGFLPAQAGSQYQALDQGSAQAADAFSTDYQLLGNKYTPLADPKGVFGFQYTATDRGTCTQAQYGKRARMMIRAYGLGQCQGFLYNDNHPYQD